MRFSANHREPYGSERKPGKRLRVEDEPEAPILM